jgi:hypothetical protein
LNEALPGSFVLVDAGAEFQPWGETPQALLYLALTEIAAARYSRAAEHLLRAAHLSDTTMPFFYDNDLMLVYPEAVRRNAPAFRRFLTGGKPLAQLTSENAALLDIFNSLLQVCCADTAGELETFPSPWAPQN